YKESMMSFPPAEDLIVEIEPEMPSMDHGSPNNEHPVHLADGHYRGKINFTMTGWWRVHITLKKGDEVVTDEAFLDITLD
ncbi:MAG: FixH family protein, partial [Bacteroidales bacterium]|nr:FixH family protein [Bacteroidales bacterium]